MYCKKHYSGECIECALDRHTNAILRALNKKPIDVMETPVLKKVKVPMWTQFKNLFRRKPKV